MEEKQKQNKNQERTLTKDCNKESKTSNSITAAVL